MTKEELIEVAKKAYFKGSKKLPLMYATEDGNFFYPEAMSYGKSHSKNTGLELLIIENPLCLPQEEKEKPKKVKKPKKK